MICRKFNVDTYHFSVICGVFECRVLGEVLQITEKQGIRECRLRRLQKVDGLAVGSPTNQGRTMGIGGGLRVVRVLGDVVAG